MSVRRGLSAGVVHRLEDRLVDGGDILSDGVGTRAFYERGVRVRYERDHDIPRDLQTISHVNLPRW